MVLFSPWKWSDFVRFQPWAGVSNGVSNVRDLEEVDYTSSSTSWLCQQGVKNWAATDFRRRREDTRRRNGKRGDRFQNCLCHYRVSVEKNEDIENKDFVNKHKQTYLSYVKLCLLHFQNFGANNVKQRNINIYFRTHFKEENCIQWQNTLFIVGPRLSLKLSQLFTRPPKWVCLIEISTYKSTGDSHISLSKHISMLRIHHF